MSENNFILASINIEAANNGSRTSLRFLLNEAHSISVPHLVKSCELYLDITTVQCEIVTRPSPVVEVNFHTNLRIFPIPSQNVQEIATTLGLRQTIQKSILQILFHPLSHDPKVAFIHRYCAPAPICQAWHKDRRSQHPKNSKSSLHHKENGRPIQLQKQKLWNTVH